MSNRAAPNRTDYYVKPSTEKQWHERSDAPSIRNDMTKAEIENHRENLARMHGCEPTEITYEFKRIENELDEDRDKFLNLEYYYNCIFQNQPRRRMIFSIKIPIPPEVLSAAKDINGARKALPPPKKTPIKPTARR